MDNDDGLSTYQEAAGFLINSLIEGRRGSSDEILTSAEGSDGNSEEESVDGIEHQEGYSIEDDGDIMEAEFYDPEDVSMDESSYNEESVNDPGEEIEIESYYSSGDDQEHQFFEGEHEYQEQFYCERCRREFSNQSSLNQHLQNNLIHIIRMACTFCDQVYSNEFDYRAHRCPLARWCANCLLFHPIISNTNNLQPTVLVDNSGLDLKEEKGMTLDMTCLICLDMMRSRVFLPCCHLACCAKCSKILVSGGGGCPVCRSTIQKIEKVILS